MNSTEKVNILLVDDQPGKLLSYQAILDSLGENLIQATSGKEALEVLLKQDVAVILLDVNMPGMDGFETASLIRRHPRFEKTPIIFVTAVHMTEPDRLKGYGLGAVDYVFVPVIPEILRTKVAVFADLHRKTRELQRLNQELEQHVAARTAEHRRAEERFRALLESAPDAIVIVNQDGRIVLVNAQTERLFGYPRSELLGELVEKLLPEPARSLHPQYRSRYFAAPSIRPVNPELNLFGLRKDGTEFPVEITLGPLGTQEGLLVSAAIRDISERKAAQEALRESEARLRTILQSEPECVKCLDQDGVLLEMNPAGLMMLEADSIDQLLGRSVLGLIEEPYREAFRALTAQVFRGEPGTLEFCLTSLRGKRHWVETHAGPYRDAHGKVVSLIGVSRDITERKRAEEALRDSEARLRLALDAAQMGTFEWDVAGNHLTWSRWHEELWGYAPEEFAGTYEAFSERVHPEDLPRIKAEIARCLATHETFTREFRVVWPDGSIHWVFTQGQFTSGPDGQPLRMHGVVMEITGRKRAEEELYSSRQRLALLSRQLISVQETERRHLARELHDEIGQIFTAVHMNLQQARTCSSPAALPRLEQAIGIVGQAIQQVRNLSLDLRPAMLDDFGLVAALKWYFDKHKEENGCQVLLQVESNGAQLPAEVNNTCFRVVQEALTNIQRHARAQQVRIYLQQSDAEVRLEVQDDGAGFDWPAVRQRALQGTSLGLLGMQERVELLGGQFAVESVRGHGSLVRVCLPIAPSDEDAAESEEEE